MANVVINDANLTNIAAAIREKNGSTDTYKPNEMAAAIRAISVNPGGGDTPASSIDFEDYIGRTLTGEVELTCERVGNYGLAGFWQVNKFTVHGNASGNNAFAGCTNLQEINITEEATIGKNSCSGLTKLTTVNAPLATEIDEKAFYSCSALTDVTLGDVVRLGKSAFEGCNKLTKIDLGNTEQAHSYYSLWIGPYLYESVFSSCNALTAIIIRGKVPCCLSQYGSPFPSHFRTDYTGTLEPGYIYVPRDMISEYQNYQANVYGMSPYYDHFTMMNYRAIEDYPDICG